MVADGDPPAGVFACAAFVRRLLELNVRVILYERQVRFCRYRFFPTAT